MTHTPMLVEPEEGDFDFAVDLDAFGDRVASGWTELVTDDGGVIGIVIVDIGFRNVWDDEKLDSAKARAKASWNATADIPVTALEQGVIAELVAFVRQIANDDKEVTGPMAVALLAKLGGQHDAG